MKLHFSLASGTQERSAPGRAAFFTQSHFSDWNTPLGRIPLHTPRVDDTIVTEIRDRIFPVIELLPLKKADFSHWLELVGNWYFYFEQCRVFAENQEMLHVIFWSRNKQTIQSNQKKKKNQKKEWKIGKKFK